MNFAYFQFSFIFVVFISGFVKDLGLFSGGFFHSSSSHLFCLFEVFIQLSTCLRSSITVVCSWILFFSFNLLIFLCNCFGVFDCRTILDFFNRVYYLNFGILVVFSIDYSRVIMNLILHLISHLSCGHCES